MSEPIIPPSNGDLKRHSSGYAFQTAHAVNEMLRHVFQDGTAAHAPARTPTPTHRPTGQRRGPRKSGLYAVLHAAQQHGFTHPKEGFWVMLPKEFDAILALEDKAVAQVVLEVLRQTMGTVVYGPDGQPMHRDWAPLSVRHFVRAGFLSLSQAEIGLKQALDKGYIVRRPFGEQRFEYAVRWRGTN
jgi:hypothetical protein